MNILCSSLVRVWIWWSSLGIKFCQICACISHKFMTAILGSYGGAGGWAVHRLNILKDNG